MACPAGIGRIVTAQAAPTAPLAGAGAPHAYSGRDLRLRTPDAPDERGTHDGRPYWLWQPASPPPWPAMVIVHGAGSGKESHADFGRLCAANGWVALTYDQRGHGESEDLMAPAALADVGRMGAFLASREGVDRSASARAVLARRLPRDPRGRHRGRIAGAIAICPASDEGLRRGLRDGSLEMRADVDALDAWLGEHDLREAAASFAPKPLILLHAQGDEQVPYTWSEELHARAGERAGC